MGEVVSLDEPVKSVTSIHESFVNADCLRYYCRAILRELGIAPDKLGGGIGDKFINDMFQRNK
jgi:hypothetical protein